LAGAIIMGLLWLVWGSHFITRIQETFGEFRQKFKIPEAICIAIWLMPTLAAAVLLTPRHHYLYLLLLIPIGISILVNPKFNPTQKWNNGSIGLALILSGVVLLLPNDYPRNFDYQTEIKFIEKLDVEPVTGHETIGILTPHRHSALLNHKWLVQGLAPNPTPKALKRASVVLLEGPGYKGWRDFIETPETFGFESLPIPNSKHLLFVRTQK
jgi:hypothetical protein